MASEITPEFTLSLPKTELHAHLTGSITRNTLHQIWASKLSSSDPKHPSGLPDPRTALPDPGCTKSIDVQTFFPLFDEYIYALVNDVDSVKLAARSVLEDFCKDGVRHLELRTTPREGVGMSRRDYVRAVGEVAGEWNQEKATTAGSEMQIYLILSVDRKMSAVHAEEVVDMALEMKYRGDKVTSSSTENWVVGVDLCGNPTKGVVSTFTPAFERARDAGLGITVHFAEIPQSSTDEELKTLLSWRPDRLGHAVHVSERFKEVIRERGLCLELCLSCNVLAKLTDGGFEEHHFGEWWDGEEGKTGNSTNTAKVKVALGTDDVGVFGSPLSREYLIAAEHFGLGRRDLVWLCRSAASAAFMGWERMKRLIDEFEGSIN